MESDRQLSESQEIQTGGQSTDNYSILIKIKELYSQLSTKKLSKRLTKKLSKRLIYTIRLLKYFESIYKLVQICLKDENASVIKKRNGKDKRKHKSVRYI